jgi:hypothetical protein
MMGEDSGSSNQQEKMPEPTRSAAKAKITKLTERELLNLVADLYRLSKENQAFVHTRLALVADPPQHYKQITNECRYPDVHKNKPIQISKAKKAISDYSKAAGDAWGEAELMTLFVEQGNAFTLEYSDIDAGFYAALNLMFRRTLEKVCILPDQCQDAFKERLETIMKSSTKIGWGYHDELRNDYDTAFPCPTAHD